MTTDPARELERILRRGSSSFYLASLALPRRVRAPTLALYAFCRHADDTVDDASDGERARRAVDALRARIDRAFAGRPTDDLVERAFADTVRAHRLPRSELDLLAEGMEWDARGRTYATLDDVRAYGLRVAGTVGVLMTHIMGPRDEDVLERARDLGIGMQMTNIARDVGTDARIGRVYLPESWLADEGTSAAQVLADPRPNPALGRVVRRLLHAADEHYRRADEGIAHLPPDCRVAVRAARLVYSEIGIVIRERAYDSISARAFVPRQRKLALLARSLGARRWQPEPLR